MNYSNLKDRELIVIVPDELIGYRCLLRELAVAHFVAPLRNLCPVFFHTNWACKNSGNQFYDNSRK